jgi:CRISPR-associated protein Cas2
MDEHLYLVAYDIHDKKRLRRVFKLMKGFGQWLQLSVADALLIIDLGPADKVSPRVASLGDRFEVVSREPIIV